jgi:hypothetical protein
VNLCAPKGGRSVVSAIAATWLSLAVAAHASSTAVPEYGLAFKLTVEAGQSQARASIAVDQKEPLLLALRFRAPTDRFTDFNGDGTMARDGVFLTWEPPPQGGKISYAVEIDNRRDSGSFDALVATNWAILKGDDVFPAARTRQIAGAVSKTTLHLRLPDHWSAVTPYPGHLRTGYEVVNPNRKFDRPTGWLLLGRLGVRRDVISGVEVAVAAPVGAGVERLGMLALIRWTLPRVLAEMVDRPSQLTLVSAPDPMWRGGLSAGNSLYVHADRPLLSENATSTLVHEMIHLLMPVPAADDHDWIDEGIAEYLCLRVLSDTGTIARERFDAAIADFRKRGRGVASMRSSTAGGVIKARAVAVFHDLDHELQAASHGEADIFTLMRKMMVTAEPLDLERLRTLARTVAGSASLDALSDASVPGFKLMQ